MITGYSLGRGKLTGGQKGTRGRHGGRSSSANYGVASSFWSVGDQDVKGRRPKREALSALPLLARDPGLAENAGQEFETDVLAVRIRNGHHDITADHELVPAAGEGALEPEGPEGFE